MESSDKRSPSGGMTTSGSIAATYLINRLSPLFPTTNAGPLSPPFSASSLRSSRNPASWRDGPWHLWQVSLSNGSISLAKVTGRLAAGGMAFGSASNSAPPSSSNPINDAATTTRPGVAGRRRGSCRLFILSPGDVEIFSSTENSNGPANQLASPLRKLQLIKDPDYFAAGTRAVFGSSFAGASSFRVCACSTAIASNC